MHILRGVRSALPDAADVEVLARLAPVAMVAAGVAELAGAGAALVAAGGLLIVLPLVRSLVGR